jgi:ribose-phosphate pyrophosphokinase
MIILNGTVVTPTIFPDRTSQVWKIPSLTPEAVKKCPAGGHRVTWLFEQEAELIHIQQISTLIRATNPERSVLDMPYLPYARQDKMVTNDLSFALQSFAEIVRTQRWHTVSTFDAHNPYMAGALLSSDVTTFSNTEPTPPQADYDIVVFPDGGARDRYEHLTDLPYAIGQKVRDQETGWITSYDFDANSIEGKRVLVWDDLCDGGATFNVLGESLGKAKYADLYVSHGLFSKGVDKLLDTYRRIITTDTTIDMYNQYDRQLSKQCPRLMSIYYARKRNRLIVQPHKWQKIINSVIPA